MNVNYTPLVNVIVSKLGNLHPRWILDVGCGGEVLNLLARHIGILHRCFVGIDINYNAMMKSTTNNDAANIKYLNADGHHRPKLYHRIFNLLQKMSKSSMIGKTFCILAKLLEKLGYQRNIVILYRK